VNEIIYHSNQPITNKELIEKITKKIGYEKKFGTYSILYKCIGNNSNFHLKKKPNWKSEPLQLCKKFFFLNFLML